MLRPDFDKAVELNKTIEFYSLIQKTLNASGVDSIIHPNLIIQFGKDFVQILKDDLLPSVNNKLEQAKNDFDKL